MYRLGHRFRSMCTSNTFLRENEWFSGYPKKNSKFEWMKREFTCLCQCYEHWLLRSNRREVGRMMLTSRKMYAWTGLAQKPTMFKEINFSSLLIQVGIITLLINRAEFQIYFSPIFNWLQPLKSIICKGCNWVVFGITYVKIDSFATSMRAETYYACIGSNECI